MIARSASGSFRDAIGTLDQLVTYGGKQVSFDDVMELLDVADAETVFAATDAVIARDPGAALRRVQELSDAGRDPVQFMRDLTAHLRHLIVVQTLGEPPDSFSVTADQVPRLESQARDLAQAEAVRAIDLLADAVAAVKDGADPRTQLELALLKATRPRADASIEALLMRLERLEQGEPDGGAPTPSPAKREAVDAPPQEGEQAPPQAPALQGDVELTRLWPAVLERVRESDGGEMMAALLADARPLTLEDDVLVLSYPASASFSKRKIEDRANGERLSQALRLVSGRPLVARFEIHDSASDDHPASTVRLTEDELIARFKSEFDAEDVADRQHAEETAATAEEN
jgi:DNA polymerase-3 subunit gamma/tau